MSRSVSKLPETHEHEKEITPVKLFHGIFKIFHENTIGPSTVT